MKMRMLFWGLILSFMFACQTTRITDVDLEDKEFSLIPDSMNFEWLVYEIKEGDSISSIASQFNVSHSTIIIYNGAQNFREGGTIKIPNIDGICHTIESGDTVSKISKIYNVPPQVIMDINGKENDTVSEGEGLFIPGAEKSSEINLWYRRDTFIFPVHGRNINNSFGWRLDPFSEKYRFHTGIDLIANVGTPVSAAMDGIVSETGNDRMYGKYIIIRHNNFYHTLYAHLASVSVNQGDHVTHGDTIGNVGNTGYSTGPHLHFGVFKYGKAVNPLNLLE